MNTQTHPSQIRLAYQTALARFLDLGDAEPLIEVCTHLSTQVTFPVGLRRLLGLIALIFEHRPAQGPIADWASPLAQVDQLIAHALSPHTPEEQQRAQRQAQRLMETLLNGHLFNEVMARSPDFQSDFDEPPPQTLAFQTNAQPPNPNDLLLTFQVGGRLPIWIDPQMVIEVLRPEGPVDWVSPTGELSVSVAKSLGWMWANQPLPLTSLSPLSVWQAQPPACVVVIEVSRADEPRRFGVLAQTIPRWIEPQALSEQTHASIDWPGVAKSALG